MVNTPATNSCNGTGTAADGELLPLSPYYALHYHFGMLLGVDDFDTEQAYHRAKMRLHNAWLHREGVVWGFGVALDPKSGEARVQAGLATDLAGRELHLDGDACLNVGQWYAKHQADLAKMIRDPNAPLFDAHIVVRFRACLARPVPALAATCQGAGGGDTAYSRVLETVEILMRPGKSPPRTPPYHRLRLLFGLDAPVLDANHNVVPADQAVLDALASILALAPAARPAACLAAFHRFAALDVIDLAPANSADGSRTLLFPDGDDTDVVLADLNGITLAKNNGGWTLTGGTVDTSVRPSHVATTTMQDLLCGVLADATGGAAGVDAAGPRFDPASIGFPDDQTVTLKANAALSPKTVTTDAFAVSAFDAAAGWQVLTVTGATLDNAAQVVTLKAKEKLGKRLIRTIARGSGPAPLLGSNLVPLAGSLIDPPATAQNGRDFVSMKQKNT
jgi:hypothetical protein